jgi:hypothetical protein
MKKTLITLAVILFAVQSQAKDMEKWLGVTTGFKCTYAQGLFMGNNFSNCMMKNENVLKIAELIHSLGSGATGVKKEMTKESLIRIMLNLAFMDDVGVKSMTVSALENKANEEFGEEMYYKCRAEAIDGNECEKYTELQTYMRSHDMTGEKWHGANSVTTFIKCSEVKQPEHVKECKK